MPSPKRPTKKRAPKKSPPPKRPRTKTKTKTKTKPKPTAPPRTLPAVFVDRDGARMLGPYDNATSFRDGYAGVRIDDAWGIIDVRGNLVIEPRFAALGELGDGLVAVREDGKVGYLDCATGAWAIEPRFDFGLGFSSGYASVITGGEIPEWSKAFQTQPSGGAWGIVDRAGRLVVDMVHGSAIAHDGVAVINEGGRASGFGGITIGGRFGYVDLATRARIGGWYAGASLMSEGRACTLHDGNSTTWTIIDRAAAPIRTVDLETSETPEPFLSGHAVIGRKGKTSHRSKYAFIDGAGEVVLDDLGEAESFSDGMAAINRGGEKVQGECRGGRWGFVALDGSFVTQPTWISASGFGDGRGIVWDKSICLVVDRAGATVFQSPVVVSPYANGLALMRVRPSDI